MPTSFLSQHRTVTRLRLSAVHRIQVVVMLQVSFLKVIKLLLILNQLCTSSPPRFERFESAVRTAVNLRS
jgi:hypothetical protein